MIARVEPPVETLLTSIGAMNSAGDPATLRIAAGWAFVAGLCVAALVAIVALLNGSFDDDDLRVVGTSLGFSVFSSTGAAGSSLRKRTDTWRWGFGSATMASAVAAFGLLLLVLWGDGSWRAFGVAGLIALWSGHAALVLGALRPGDSPLIRMLAGVAVVTLGVDAGVGVLALVGSLDDTDVDGVGQLLAALLVVALLATALPPVLRRLQGVGEPRRRSRNGLADGVADVADRLGAMDLPPQARAEIARLRELVREAGG
jgi:hypothetical protein